MDKTSLIYKVLEGNASEGEKIELMAWIGQSEENKAEYQDIKLLWENSNEIIRGTNDHFYAGLRKIKTSMQSKHKRDNLNKIILLTLILVVLVILFFCWLSPEKREDPPFLRFDNASLEIVISTIEVRYNIHIQVADEKILACGFTGIFYHADSGQNVTQSLAKALDLTYEMLDDQHYRLIGIGCLSRHQ